MPDTQGLSEGSGLSPIPFSTDAENRIKGLSSWLSVVAWLSVSGAAINLLNLILPTRNLGQIADVIINIAFRQLVGGEGIETCAGSA